MKRIALGLAAAAVLGVAGVASAGVGIDTYVQDDSAGVEVQADEAYVNCLAVLGSQTAGCSTSAGDTPTADELMTAVEDARAQAEAAVAGAKAAAEDAVAGAEVAAEELFPPSPCSATLPSGPEDLENGIGVSCSVTFPASPGETPELEVPVDGLPAQTVLPPTSTDPVLVPSHSINVPMVGTITTPSVSIGSASIPAITTLPVPGQTILVPSQPLPSVGETTCTLSGAVSIFGFGLNGGC